MKNLRRAALIALLTAGLAPAIALAPASGMAEEAAGGQATTAAPFFYNLTTDDAWTAGMALAQASTAAGRGHKVAVFLNVRAVHLADRDAQLGSFGPLDKTPAELLAALMAKGGTVLVCGMCMKAAGMEAADLIDGAMLATPDLTFGAMTESGTVTLSY